jgi:hypothetical protein
MANNTNFCSIAGEVGIGEFMAEIYFLAKLTLSLLHKPAW